MTSSSMVAVVDSSRHRGSNALSHTGQNTSSPRPARSGRKNRIRVLLHTRRW